jgi:hypothetical protein
VNGDVPPAFLLSAAGVFAPLFALRDSVWDILTMRAYAEYVNDNVFSPASVASRDFSHADEAALAYQSPSDAGNGWNSSDLQSACGAVGWHLTVRELLRVLRTFRRAGNIMSASRAQRMLDNGFGIDLTRNTIVGPVYAKGGWWSNGTRVEQSSAWMLPRSMELVILANSPSCGGASFFNQVADAIDQSTELRLATLVTSVVARVLGH